MARKKNQYVCKNGYWYLREWVPYTVDGKTKYKEIISPVAGDGKATKANTTELQLKKENFLKDLEDKKTKPTTSNTVDYYFFRWLHFYKINITNATITAYTTQYNNLLKPLIGSKPITEVTPNDILKLRMSMIDRASGTQKKALVLIRSIFKYALRDGVITSNPTDNIPQIRLEYQETIAPRTVDLYTVLDMVKKSSQLLPQYKLAIIIAANEGLRVSEICGIVTENIDLNKGVLHVHRKISSYFCYITKKMAAQSSDKLKSKKSRRTISLTHETIAEINKYLSEHSLELHPEEKLTYLLQTDDGNFISPKLVGAAYFNFVKWHKKQGKLPDDYPTGIHKTRAHLTTVLRKAGYDRFAIADQLGHTPAIADDHYAQKETERTDIKDVYANAVKMALMEAKIKQQESELKQLKGS